MSCLVFSRLIKMVFTMLGHFSMCIHTVQSKILGLHFIFAIMAEPEAKKAKKVQYNKKFRSKPHQKRICFDVIGDEENIDNLKERIDKAKSYMSGGSANKQVNNGMLLETLLDYYIAAKDKTNDGSQNSQSMRPQSYLAVTKESVDQPLFLAALESIEQLTNLVAHHVRNCEHATFQCNERYKTGHAAGIGIQCTS